MGIPCFYVANIGALDFRLTLDEETSKHIIQVLRMKLGESLQLTDGKGKLVEAVIVDDHKKKCSVQIKGERQIPKENRRISIGISPLKNGNRFEWFLEKATEIGIVEIFPLICARTEKQHLRIDRLRTILISALLQSQRAWLPELHEPMPFAESIKGFNHQQKFIAHCEEKGQRNLSDLINSNLNSQIILIGPEGDFTPEEIALALDNKFLPVSLGPARLRTETAALVAVTLLNVK
jgi:16S rRNA (uracil1498-N3)-methyltransferase